MLHIAGEDAVQIESCVKTADGAPCVSQTTDGAPCVSQTADGAPCVTQTTDGAPCVSQTTDGCIYQQVSAQLYKVSPSVTELGAPIQKDIACPVSDCGNTFAQTSALRLHLEKTHKIFNVKHPWELPTGAGKATVNWHCPTQNCVYNMKSERFFSSRSLLRQHFYKMHVERTLACDVCGYRFSLDKDLRRHQRACSQGGLTCSCGQMYVHRESYLSHCARKQHAVLPKYQTTKKPAESKKLEASRNSTKSRKTTSPPDISIGDSMEMKPRQKRKPYNIQKAIQRAQPYAPKPILPNPSCVILVMSDCSVTPSLGAIPKQLIYVADATRSNRENWRLSKCKPKLKAKSAVEVRGFDSTNRLMGSDLDIGLNVEHGDVAMATGDTCSTRLTAGTQTLSQCDQRTAAQTQTTGDFILRSAMQCAQLPIQRQSRASQVSPRAKLKRGSIYQSIETQTPKLPYRKRRRKMTVDSHTVTSHMSVTTEGALVGQTISIPDLWNSQSTSETQTAFNNLQKKLESETASTQTIESFDQALSELSATVDQAILCDLGLTSQFNRPPNLVNVATSPRAKIRSQTLTVDCGTQPLFDIHDSDGTESDSTLNSLSNDLARHIYSEDQEVMNSSHGSLSVCFNANFESVISQQAPVLTSSATNEEVIFGRDSFIDSVNLTLTDGDLYTSNDTHIGTQTTNLDFPEFLTSSVQTSDLNTSYMHIETQTMDDDLIDQFLSNMQTQTNDDFLADLGFSDTQTQTYLNLHDLSVNTETQTQSDVQSAASVAIQTQFSVNAAQLVSPPSVGIQTHLDSQMVVPSIDTQTQTFFTNLDLCPDLSDSFTQTGLNELESFVYSLP